MEEWQRNKITEIVKEEIDNHRGKNKGGYSLALSNHHHHPAHQSSDWFLLNNNGGMRKALVAGIHLSKSLSIVEKKRAEKFMKQLPLLSRELSVEMWAMSWEETDERQFYCAKRTRQDKSFLIVLSKGCFTSLWNVRWICVCWYLIFLQLSWAQKEQTEELSSLIQ